jgi:thiosulfate/3-mercaptopyruvate sulfurtransferase
MFSLPVPTGLRRLAHAVLLGAALAAPAFTAPALAAEPLVSVAWLKSQLDQTSTPSDIVVLDIRSAIDGGGTEAYAKGHIPGAVHSDYDKAGWRVTRNNIPLVTPSTAQLEKLIGELGIDEESHVVVVPAGVHASDFGAAARVYWTLKLAGVPNISILDGGTAAWTAAGHPLETEIRRPSPKIFTATRDDSVLIEGNRVAALTKQGGATLLDARPATFFEGKVKAPTAKAYGHIPGAINLEHASFYDAKTNRLKPAAELAAAAARLPAAGPIVSYCNTGHWAATNWFVLSEILGRKDVTLYDGSMTEWTADASRPIESARTKWDDLKKALGFGT